MRLNGALLKRRCIGNKAFYRRTLAVLVPMIIQNTITNVVSLLDNVMVGQVGTLQMSAVSIVNQLMFIFNLCIFGGLAGAGIFSAQYAGAGDNDGLRFCLRIKQLIGAGVLAIGLGVFLFAHQPLISMYLTDPNADAVAQTFGFAREYLFVMLAGLLPFAVTQVYASTLRETGETRIPMIGSVVAILLNLVLNWVLIFGNLGAPKLGVVGAAVATVISRWVEMCIVAGYTHRHSEKYPFIVGAYGKLEIPSTLWKNICTKGLPLLLNEVLWSTGVSLLLQCYSTRGLSVVAACNINSTVSNLFNVVFIAMGSAVSVLVGQSLGADDMEGAQDDAWRLIVLGVLSSMVIGSVMFFVAPLIPHLYNTTEDVFDIATRLLRVNAVLMPLFCVCNNCYFILRAGGRTIITFLFDSAFVWVFSYTTAWCLAYLTNLDVVTMFMIVEGMNLLKCIFGLVLVGKNVWLRNMVK